MVALAGQATNINFNRISRLDVSVSRYGRLSLVIHRLGLHPWIGDRKKRGFRVDGAVQVGLALSIAD